MAYLPFNPRNGLERVRIPTELRSTILFSFRYAIAVSYNHTEADFPYIRFATISYLLFIFSIIVVSVEKAIPAMLKSPVCLMIEYKVFNVKTRLRF